MFLYILEYLLYRSCDFSYAPIAFIQDAGIKSAMSSDEDRRPEGEEDPETAQPDEDKEDQPPAGTG